MAVTFKLIRMKLNYKCSFSVGLALVQVHNGHVASGSATGIVHALNTSILPESSVTEYCSIVFGDERHTRKIRCEVESDPGP